MKPNGKPFVLLNEADIGLQQIVKARQSMLRARCDRIQGFAVRSFAAEFWRCFGDHGTLSVTAWERTHPVGDRLSAGLAAAQRDRGARARRLEAVTELVADALAPPFRSRPIEGRVPALVIPARR